MAPTTDDELLQLVGRGDVIAAIKLRRETTGEDLATAKAYVDGLRHRGTAGAPAAVVGAEGLDAEVARLLRREKSLIHAVKRIREATGASLKEALDRAYGVAEREGLTEYQRPTRTGALVQGLVFLLIVAVCAYLATTTCR
jgi:ribosomal protein L7/L12